MRTTPSPGYTITIRVEMNKQVGMFAKIAAAVGEVGGDIAAVDIVRAGRGSIVRDFTVNARDEKHEKDLVEAVRGIDGTRVIHVTDRTFLVHQVGNAGDQFGFIDLVGQLTDDYLGFAGFSFFDFSLAANYNPSPTCRIDFGDRSGIINGTGGGEIGAFDKLH
jgi:hypothetical protein